MHTTNPLLNALRDIRASRRIALCGYFLAGYPTPETFYRLVRAASMLDVIEYGIPADNPTLDGPVIAQAHSDVIHQRGLGAETALALIGGLQDIRQPRFVMTYSYVGRELDGFLRFCLTNGLHGMLAPDMDEDEMRFVATIMRALNLAVVRLIDAQADEATVERSVRLGDIIYLKAAPGPSGTSAALDGALFDRLDQVIHHIRALKPEMPIGVGIGIQRPEQVAALARLGVDMAVIGTRLVEQAALGEGSMVAYLQAMRAAAQSSENPR
jgi:tryptophan synthase alpha chain